MQSDTPNSTDVDAIRKRFEGSQARLNAAKIAYMNGTPLGGEDVTYDVLKRVAQEAIRANYDLQKATYGSIRLKLSVAKLLRRGR